MVYCTSNFEVHDRGETPSHACVADDDVLRTAAAMLAYLAG